MDERERKVNAKRILRTIAAEYKEGRHRQDTTALYRVIMDRVGCSRVLAQAYANDIGVKVGPR